MVYFQTKTPNLGKVWSALQRFLWPFGMFCGHFWCVCFFQFWYVVPRKIWQPWTSRLKKIRPLISFRVTFNSAAIKKLSLSQKRNVRPVFFVIVCKLSEGRSRHISSGHHCVRSVNGEKKRHFEIEWLLKARMQFSIRQVNHFCVPLLPFGREWMAVQTWGQFFNKMVCPQGWSLSLGVNLAPKDELWS
jgi:hypothetical protein